jgi:hypothetical protein
MSEDRTPDEPEAAEEHQPMNRAERRAKGKKSAQTNFSGKQGFSPKGAGAHSHRNWSNRRSGG